MHIISRKRVREAKLTFPHSAESLEGWYRLATKNKFKNFAELKIVFGSVDKVKNLFVFNIAGNKLRLIAGIHFNRQKIFIRNILDHSDYDKGHWKK